MNIESLDIKLFNKNNKYIENKLFIYCSVVGFLLVLLVVIMCLLEKDLYYQNEIYIINKNEAILYILPNDLEIIKDNKFLIVNSKKYYYNISDIKLISDKALYYQIDLYMDNDLLVDSFNSCKILLRKESLFSYIVRIVKGG